MELEGGSDSEQALGRVDGSFRVSQADDRLEGNAIGVHIVVGRA